MKENWKIFKEEQEIINQLLGKDVLYYSDVFGLFVGRIINTPFSYLIRPSDSIENVCLSEISHYCLIEKPVCPLLKKINDELDLLFMLQDKGYKNNINYSLNDLLDDYRKLKGVNICKN